MLVGKFKDLHKIRSKYYNKNLCHINDHMSLKCKLFSFILYLYYILCQDPLEFPAHELMKFFKEGDHVKVIKGKYEGDTGLIVRVEEEVIVLFSDLTFHEVCINYTYELFWNIESTFF